METQNTESRTTSLLWKIPVLAAVYFGGTLISAALVTSIGLRFPEMPGQTYVPVLSFLTALVIVGCLAFLARGLAGSFFKRWTVLFSFLYVVFVVANQIEASVYTVTRRYS